MFTILHIIERLTLGGASRALIGLSKYSQREGPYRHRVISLLPAQAEAVALAGEDGLEVVVGSDSATLENEVRNADLVQIHWWNAPALQGLIRNGLPPCRLMVWCHVVGDTLPNLITPELIDFADVIIASNPYTYSESKVFESLPPELRKQKVGMIVDPTDFERVKRVRPIAHSGFNVGYIGTVGMYKMHADFIEMSSGVAVPEVKFLVCGGGIEAQLQLDARRLGTESRFEFMGYQEDIASVIGRMDVYGYPLCPDTYASGELNLQEVMYSGIPPVVFPYGGVRRLVIHEFTGLVVDTKREYQEAIEYLYHNPDQRRRLGENAAHYARQMFGAENAAQRLNEFFGRMLEAEKRVHPGTVLIESESHTRTEEQTLSGARLFAESMGSKDNPFLVSLNSEIPDLALSADDEIQTMSPVVHIAGILEYLNQSPQDPWLRYWSALVTLGQGQVQQAFDALRELQRAGFDHWRLNWFLGFAAQRLNRTEEANAALAVVRSTHPGLVLNSGEAADESPSGIRPHSPCPEPFPAVARVQAHPPQSAEAFDRSSDSAAMGRLDAAEAAWKAEDPAGVDSHLEALRAVGFEDGEAYFRIGRLWFNRGRFSEAADALKAGLTLSEGSVRVLTQLAACSLELERVDEFESYLDRAMKADPSDPMPHKFLAHLNVGHGAFADGARICRDILQLFPEDVEVLELLASCFEHFEEFESELATYDEILRIRPENPAIEEKRLRCLEKGRGARDSELNAENAGIRSQEEPLVSAIVSTYNSEAHIGACIEDLLAQTIIDRMEIIVIDSGSEQSEQQIVADYQRRHTMIRYVRTETRETLYQAWNRAIDAARGRYVFNANTDDSRRCDAVERLVNAMEAAPGAALAYADCVWTAEPNQSLPDPNPIREVRYPEYHPALALFYCYSGCLQFWRTEEIRALGCYDGSFRAAGDYEVLMRVVRAGKQVVHVPEILSGFYQNRSGLTQQSSVSATEENEAREEFRKTLEISMLYAVDESDRVAASIAWTALGCFARGMRVPWHDGGLGDDGFALQCFQKALLLDAGAEKAAANLLVILREHDQLEIGKKFLTGPGVGWTDSQWHRIVSQSCAWTDVEVPLAVFEGGESDCLDSREPNATDSTEPDVSNRLVVSWSAPFFNPSGYGSEALNFVVPLQGVVPMTIRHNSSIVSQDFVTGLLNEDRRRLNDLVPKGNESSGDISICHGPVSCFELVPGARYHIGRTMFETDRIPTEWVRRCNLMDEIWVPTEFNRRTFIESGVESRKIVVIPGAVDEGHFDPDRHEGAALPNRASFNFLSVFEWIWRKGWDVLLRAYFTEFGPDDDVCLYLRTYECNCPDGDAREVLEERVLRVAREMGLNPDRLPRFEILADQVAYEDLPSLYQAAQCLVAPSRGEGWGRPHHEAMMMGVPVIATDWSGNTEFMNDENSYLLNYQLTLVRGVEAAFKIYDGHEWAEPSVDHLKQLMRRAFQAPDEAARKGALAREQMLERFSRQAVATAVKQRLSTIEQQLAQPVLPIPENRGHDGVARESIGEPTSRTINWVGPYSDFGSLAQVNRYWTEELKGRYGKKLVRVQPEGFSTGRKSNGGRFPSDLREREDTKAGVTIRHQWPPNFGAHSGDGALVVIQPWEFGSLPAEWVQASDTIDEFWVYTEYVRRVYVDSGIDPKKVKIAPLGVDPEIYSSQRPAFPLPTEKRFKFLFVGGTIARKGPDALLRAYGSAFSDTDDVTLVIKDFGGGGVYAGQTLEAEIEAFRRRPGSPEVIYLNRELSDDEVAGLYVACDCLVHPYRGEGFGLPVLEAMSAGLPVVVTRGGACDDFTPDDCAYGIEGTRRLLGREVGGMELIRDAWWLEPSVESLAATLDHIAANREEAKTRGIRAAAYVRERWTWKHAADRATELVGSLLERFQAKSPTRVSARQRVQQKIVLPSCARKGDLAGARALFGKKRYTAAWDAICKEIEERPFHPEAYLLLAEVAYTAGDNAQANACLRIVAQMVPHWAPAKQFARKLRKRKGRQRQRDALGDIPVPKGQPRISVCLIARNEERFIGPCLDSVRALAHEIIVVDTGSDDRTVAIAEEKGAKVFHFEWADDFSKARNEALRHVTGDWVLVLDADEEMASDAVADLRREVNDRKSIGFRLPLLNEGAADQGTAYVPRLFRNAPGLFYVGRIHEQVFSSLEVRRRQWGMENRLGRSRIIHHGYTEEMTQSRDKVARNLKLLRLAVDEIPNDPNLLMNLALELSRSGDESESLATYRQAFEAMIELPESDIVPEMRESLLTQYTSALVRNQRFEDARNVFLKPQVPDTVQTASLLYIKGLSHMRTGEFEEAVAAFRDSVAKRQDSTYSNGYREAYGPAPLHCEALCLQKLGRDEEAKQAFEKAVADPDVTWAIVKDFAITLSSAGSYLEALTLLHSKLSLYRDEPAFWLLGARIALDHPPSYEFALDWIGEGQKYVGQHAGLMVQYVKALLLNDQTELPEQWAQAIDAGAESSALWAVRLMGSLVEGKAVEGIVPVTERELSFEFVRFYRRLLEGNAKQVVTVVNEHLSLIEPLAPTAVRLVRSALEEATAEPVGV